MVWSKTKVFVTSGTVLVLLTAGVVVKRVYFPAVDEQFFQLDSQRLQRAPANVLILRPTHFVTSRRSGYFAMPASSQSGQYEPNRMRMLGRNVSLEQAIAMAYQCQPSRLVLPPDMPTNRYDFLVTVRDKPAERLQAAVKRKLGYTGQWQERETEVLQLKVQTPHAAGLRASSADNANVNFKNGRLYFTHLPMGQLCGMLESVLKKPVQDKTALSGSYDFSILWNWRGADALDEKAIKGSLAELGLTLKSDSDTMRMLVVERVK